MNNIIYSFIVTSLAGFSTLLGLIPCFFNKKYKELVIPFTLSFSAGIMLSISLLSLIKEGIFLLNYSNYYLLFLYSFIFVVIGIIISFNVSYASNKFINNDTLLKLGIISLIVLVLHNIPEGITTFLSSSYNHKFGLKIALGIALHNIPEGIAISVPLYYSTRNFKKTFLVTFIAGFSEVLGGVFSLLFYKYISNLSLGIILLITAGIMIHVSIYELLPEGFSYKNKKACILAFFISCFSFYLFVRLLG